MLGFAALALVFLVGATMTVIVEQLAGIPQPQQTTLFVQNVLALVILVSLGAYLMRAGLTGRRKSDRQSPLKLFDMAMIASLGLLFAGLIAIYLLLSGISLEALLSGPLARLGAWYALASIAGAAVFFFLSHRDHLLLAGRRESEQDDKLKAITEELSQVRAEVFEKEASEKPTVIPVKSVGRIDFMPVGEIRYISAARNYVELHGEGRTLLHRQSLRELLMENHGAGLVQIHRSQAVNLSFVREYRRHDGEKASVILEGGESLAVGPSYRQALLENLEKAMKALKADRGTPNSPVSSQLS